MTKREFPKIFHKFDLNFESIDKLTDEDRTKLNLPEAGKKLREELLKKGYNVLESSTNYYDLPESIIIGGVHEMDHKGDFKGIVERLGLMYKSGDFYNQRNGKVIEITTEGLENIIKAGTRLELLSSSLSNIYTDMLPYLMHGYLTAIKGVSEDELRNSRKEKIKRYRNDAQKYMKEAQEIGEKYSNSKFVQRRLDDMKKTLNMIIEHTTDEKIEKAVSEMSYYTK